MIRFVRQSEMFVLAIVRFMLIIQWGIAEGNRHIGVKFVWLRKEKSYE